MMIAIKTKMITSISLSKCLYLRSEKMLLKIKNSKYLILKLYEVETRIDKKILTLQAM